MFGFKLQWGLRGIKLIGDCVTAYFPGNAADAAVAAAQVLVLIILIFELYVLSNGFNAELPLREGSSMERPTPQAHFWPKWAKRPRRGGGKDQRRN